MGADYTLLSSRDVSEEDMVKKIHELLDGQPDVSFDASGAQATVRLAMLVSRHNTYFQMNLFHNGLLSHLYIRVIHIHTKLLLYNVVFTFNTNVALNQQ